MARRSSAGVDLAGVDAVDQDGALGGLVEASTSFSMVVLPGADAPMMPTFSPALRGGS